MRLFISYSTDDLEIVNQIADALRPHAEVFFWDKDKEPGKAAWQTIFGWIDSSDLVIAVITDKTVSRAMSVGQEIGRAKTLKKTTVPLVAPGIPESELGCLGGITYITLSESNVQDVIQTLEGLIYKTKKRKQQDNTKFWITMGILGLIAIFSGADEEEDYPRPKPKRRKRK